MSRPEGKGGKRRERTRCAPSIDNYSFRRVARRGQISILKRRARRGTERRERSVSRPERYEILGVVSPFVVVVVVPQLLRELDGGVEEEKRGERGGGLMYARRELPPSDNCPMWARSLLVATSIGHVSMFKRRSQSAKPWGPEIRPWSATVPLQHLLVGWIGSLSPFEARVLWS